MSSTHSRTSTVSSLMQDVPGGYPETPSRQESTFQSVSQTVHARRAEYTRTKHVRIKIGTWNVAAFKGTEKDVGGWFVEGKGVTEALAGLRVNDQNEHHGSDIPDQAALEDREDVAAQEARYARKQLTIPRNDPGSLPGNEDIGMYVLGLQEVIDVNSASEALRPYTDQGPANKWKTAMQTALPQGYQLVAEQQLIGLLLLIYAAPQVAQEVKSVSTTSVGTGLMGYMGNKGAVTARIVLGETTRLVFINSHLAAGADKASLDRRNWDTSQIVSRTRFDPIQDSMDLTQNTGEQIGDEDFAFWVGDLNYRLEGIPGDDVRRLLMLHTRNEYDLSQRSAQKIESEIESATESVKRRVEERTSIDSESLKSPVSDSTSSSRVSIGSQSTVPTLVDELEASSDPTSLQTTLASLLPHDELHQQMKSRKAFHDGWREGPINFLPTYKYDAGSVGVFDSSEKKRAPSWCDRILFRTRRDRLAYESSVKEEENARKKDEEMKANGFDHAGDDDEILYDYDPENDAADDARSYDESAEAPPGVVITKEGFEDEVRLDYYTAHQRVLSSDHKPLDAVFTLKYDAVVPELKSKVHAEVARQLDKAENEGRPDVTVVVDRHRKDSETSDEDPASFEGVSFGDVRWAQSKHRSLTIANTSRVPASISFIERPVGPGQTPGIAPKWLNVAVNDEACHSHDSDTRLIHLEPGETCNVQLSMRIFDMNLVQELNEGFKSLDDILVLRVEGGRDHFIPLRGHWQDSSLGRGIDKLIRIPEGGIRKLQHQRPESSRKSGSSSDGQPVRYSAPRELFRLTETIEDLSTRVIAEWEMTSADPAQKAPWEEHVGWPFDEACWTQRDTEQFETALSNACNALDTDQALDANLPETLPRMQRLYVLASLLMLFMQSMPDGIVTEDTWRHLQAAFLTNEKAKRKLTPEEEKMALQEILAGSPSHSISFILIVSMLDRILGEIKATGKSRPSSSETARPEVGPIRRFTFLGKTPTVAQSESANTIMARLFAQVMVRTPEPASEKEKAATEARRTRLLECFLSKEDHG